MALTCLYIFNQFRFKEKYVITRCYLCWIAMGPLNRSNRLFAFGFTVCKTGALCDISMNVTPLSQLSNISVFVRSSNICSME